MTTNLNIAIGFWGIMRSTHITHTNIHKNVIEPLRNMGCNVRIYVHTYKINGIYTNRWAREGATTIDEQLYKLLTPDVYQIDSQDEFDTTYNLKEYTTHGDPWKNNFCSMQNLIRYLNSQNQLVHLIDSDMKENGYTFDAVFLMRPDAKYNSAITTEIVQKASCLKANELLIPDFNHWGGVNDRMAIGKWETIKVYGTRITDALEYSKKNRLHSETFLKDYLNSKGIVWKPIKFSFQLVRTNGRIINT
jgi:hypothetical protein